MRFMVMVKASGQSEDGELPSEEDLTAMGRYNEELIKAGVLLAGEGLHASSRGARVKFTDGVPTVIDGPFAEAKELVAGFWLLEVKSKEEAVEWVKRIPWTDGVESDVEIRQVFEADDLTAAVTANKGR
ncbi:YciI family protein [Actinophytocola glycyrrhizae]|uniref:YciI family protein n=1 Tax=Actinophytocola glycyrrhizae TaxID=2044873 RepID=A0ABV9SAA4_9PSEU